MKPRPTIRERLAAYPAVGLLAALLAPLVLVLVSASAQAAEPTQLCVPSDTAACIVGTLRSEEDTVADVDIIITAPSRVEDEQHRPLPLRCVGRWQIERVRLRRIVRARDLLDERSGLDGFGLSAVVSGFSRTSNDGQTAVVSGFSRTCRRRTYSRYD